MNYKDKIEEKRKAIVETLIEFIETNPQQWESGWYSMPQNTPINGKTQKKYKGLNSFYLTVKAAMKGYKDPRWVTYNQAKELGANVNAGEKSSEVMYWTWYDKATKKPFEQVTVEGMEKEERAKYIEENVCPVLKFYQVFNAQQCSNMPEYVIEQTPEMANEEQARQNELIERVIANSAAPVMHDGGSRAYYAPLTDSIHLPEIKAFKSMQDYYATALHEIAHSTGHESRLNRKILNAFGTADYAKEELCAELASVFMQTELGISVEGKHFENHGAYLASWLKAVKNNPKEFYAAASDAEKIADYVSENYLKERDEESEESETSMRFAETEKRINAVEPDKQNPKVQAMSMLISAAADESGIEYKPEYQYALRKIEYDVAVARLICYANHPEKKKRFERDEQRTLIFAKLLGEYLQGAGIAELPEEVREAHTEYALSEVDTAYSEEVENIYGEIRQEKLKQFEAQANKVAECRAAMYASIQEDETETAVYAIRIENVPEVDEEGRETESEQKVTYIINGNGEIESCGALSVGAETNEILAGLPYAGEREYKEVSYSELEARASAKSAPIRAYADALKKDDEIHGRQERNEYYYKHCAEETLEEYRASMQETKFRSDEIQDTEGDVEQAEKEVRSRIETTEKEQPAEEYMLAFGLNYSKIAFLNESLKRMGYIEDETTYEQNQKKDAAAWKAGLEFWTDDIRYKGEHGKTIEGIYTRESEFGGVLITATEITRFITHGMTQAETEQVAEMLRSEFGIEVEVVSLQTTQNADEQAEGAEQAQQEADNEKENTKEQKGSSEWQPIELSPEQIGEERGQSTMIRMPHGEYSSFVFFVPTKLLRHDGQSGKVKVSVNESYKYNLTHEGLQVELTGGELRAALAGKEIGKGAQRAPMSRMNKRRLDTLAENVPDEMRLMPNWCAYKTRWNNEKGKKDKFILSPIDGKWAKSSDPATWTDFETAMEFAKRNNCEGLAFALDGKSGISCIDLDHSVNEQGELSAPAKRLTDEISDTYTETSVSGNGIHIFVKEDILSNGKYKNRANTSEGEIEVYDTGRFISMTGNIRSKTTQLGKCPVATTQWLRATLGEKVKQQQNQSKPRSYSGVDKSDEAVVERIRKSKKGSEFDALYRGVDITGDDSRNDFKMMNILAFFTDCDTAQMERIFTGSALYRPEKGEQYLKRSIDKACSTLTTRMSDKALGLVGAKAQTRSNVK